MYPMKLYSARPIVLILLFNFLLFGIEEVTAKEPLVVFLVRHAEKADAGNDPELTPSGKMRAMKLAEVLRDSRIEHVHSSDFIRTRNTAAPIAARLGLKVQHYDPNDLPVLVAKLRKAEGRHLVVGHSNTTPRAVKLFGGESGSAIYEKSEYDRLYIVTIDEEGKASTVLLRYGKPYVADQK
ncbi:MAG TPA: hypothetical protein EYQ50_22805 [Verrucomicrobiales bacterium]|nr:hypothetical protein [Verrucomicrobiales bacterium]HIL70162.1 hypothetical protein [Verrucomicrobiota bacterium]